MSKYPVGCVFNFTTIWQIKENWSEDGMTIKDEWGNEVFNVKPESFSGVYEFIDCRVDEVVGQVNTELGFRGMPKFDIIIDGKKYAKLKQDFGFLQKVFSIQLSNGESIMVKGDWSAHSYEFLSEGKIIAFVEKEFITHQDTYNLIVMPGQNVVFILACCLIIDKCTTES